MTNLVNNTSPIALGIADTRAGAALVSSGVARIAEGIVAAWSTPMRWSYGEGDGEVVGFFCLGEMFTDVRNEKGEVDSKVLPAKYRAVADNYGVEGEFEPADKVAFKRAWVVAAAHRAGEPVDFVTITGKGGKKLRAIEVPASTAFDLYKEDGSPTEVGKLLEADARRILKRMSRGKKEATPEQVVEEAKATPVACVGGRFAGNVKAPSMTDIVGRLTPAVVAAGYMAAPKKRAGRTDKGVAFIESVVNLTAMLAALVRPEGDEVPFALANDGERKLMALAETIAAYFVANPFDADAEVEGDDEPDLPIG